MPYWPLEGNLADVRKYNHLNIMFPPFVISRYLEGDENVAVIPGLACSVAQQEKRQRYPCTNGILVIACAAEVFGRKQ